jgi:hypothetical protein
VGNKDRALIDVNQHHLLRYVAMALGTAVGIVTELTELSACLIAVCFALAAVMNTNIVMRHM